MFKTWFVHNVFAHPFMEILRMVGLKSLGEYVHNVTVPLE